MIAREQHETMRKLDRQGRIKFMGYGLFKIVYVIFVLIVDCYRLPVEPHNNIFVL